MAVGAEENALARFCSHCVERPGQPSVCQPELFSGAVHVVELQRTDVLVITAEAAAPAGFGHERLLQLAPSPRNGL
jgi:hypothetical protein